MEPIFLEFSFSDPNDKSNYSTKPHVTHMSQPRFLPGDRYHNDPVHQFSHPFNIACNLEAKSTAHWPKLFLKVCSYDYWDRHRVIGYGWVSLPQTPGHHKLTVTTWYPRGTRQAQLRSWFIGGSPEVQDIQNICVGSAADQIKILNKFGLQTVTSGSVEIIVDTIIQGHTKVEDRRAKVASSGRNGRNKTSMSWRKARDVKNSTSGLTRFSSGKLGALKGLGRLNGP